MSEIKEFWVVTKPSKESVLEDILFKSTIKEMRNQFVGGLKASEIIGIYTTHTEAVIIAMKLLK